MVNLALLVNICTANYTENSTVQSPKVVTCAILCTNRHTGSYSLHFVLYQKFNAELLIPKMQFCHDRLSSGFKTSLWEKLVTVRNFVSASPWYTEDIDNLSCYGSGKDIHTHFLCLFSSSALRACWVSKCSLRSFISDPILAAFFLTWFRLRWRSSFSLSESISWRGGGVEEVCRGWVSKVWWVMERRDSIWRR